jgi:hypothetical protein
MKKRVAILLVALLIMTVTIFSFGDSVIKAANYLKVNEGELIKGDFIVAGSEVNNMGTVTGDLIAGTEDFYNNGQVGGDIIVGTNHANIEGEVDGDVRIGAQTLDIGGIIHKNVTAFSNRLIVDGIVEGSLTAFGNSVIITGEVGGDYRGAMASTSINGIIKGNVDLRTRQIDFGPSAVIEGNLIYRSPHKIIIPEGAVNGNVKWIESKDTEIEKEKWQSQFNGFGSIWKILSGVGYLLIGIVLYLLARRFFINSGRQIKTKPGLSIGIGFLILIVTPIAALLFMITIIGIPLSLITLIVYGLAIYLTRLPVAQFISQLISRKDEGSLFTFVIGLILLTVAVKIPYAGFVFSFIITLFGLGGYLLAARSYTEKKPETKQDEGIKLEK